MMDVHQLGLHSRDTRLKSTHWTLEPLTQSLILVWRNRFGIMLEPLRTLRDSIKRISRAARSTIKVLSTSNLLERRSKFLSVNWYFSLWVVPIVSSALRKDRL